MDTINRLLKKQAPKRRGKISAAETTATAIAGGTVSTPNDQSPPEGIEFEKPNPVFIRWISNHEGNRVGVPEEWLGSPMGRIFEGGGIVARGSRGMGRGRMVEEVEG